MPDKIFMYLLIICVIWFQEITGTVADKEIRESSNILVRQKRVLNHIPSEDLSVSNKKVPYIVKIRHNNRFICVGSILSHFAVITAALCVEIEEPQYNIVSGSARTDKGKIHTVINIKKHYGNHTNRPADGIALLKVNPSFVYGTFTNSIQLHSGPLLPGTLGTVSGWGHNVRESAGPGTCNIKSVRSIVVPIISHQNCVNRYQPQIQISDLDICTYHPQKHCGHTDGGAPLVVDSYLAGVYLWSGPGRLQNNREYPDVFAVLQHSAYNQWIMSNI